MRPLNISSEHISAATTPIPEPVGALKEMNTEVAVMIGILSKFCSEYGNHNLPA
jgi:hypothetical protein